MICTSFLKDCLLDFPRTDRNGGGVGVLLRKGFTANKRKDHIPFTSMEYIDLDVSCGSSIMRLVTIYRPTRSKKNRSTPSIFLKEFSSLLESLTLDPGYLLLSGDFNFLSHEWEDNHQK